MIPIAKPEAAPVAAMLPPKAVFRIFQDSHGRWCVRSDDGMTGGTIFAREAALRFVKHETMGLPALVLHIAPGVAR